MNLSKQTARRFREIFLDGDWVTGTNFKKELGNVSLSMANTQVGSFNTIALLTFHIHYYVQGVLQVLEGGDLTIKDKYSFDMKPLSSEEEWEGVKQQLLSDAERFVMLIEQMPEEKLRSDFINPTYGNYLRNIDALIEHGYYHLGQIVMLKRMV